VAASQVSSWDKLQVPLEEEEEEDQQED